VGSFVFDSKSSYKIANVSQNSSVLIDGLDEYDKEMESI